MVKPAEVRDLEALANLAVLLWENHSAGQGRPVPVLCPAVHVVDGHVGPGNAPERLFPVRRTAERQAEEEDA